MTSGKRPTNATMNRSGIGAPLHQQEVPPLPPRLSTSSCDRHPDLPVTGFCASCLRERLQVLDPNQQQPPTAPNASSSALRRCKSFSFARERPTYSASSSQEPHRRSCDARSRSNSTISSLFHIHPEAAHLPHPPPEITPEPDTRPMKEHIDLDGQSRRPGSFWVAASVFSKKLQSWRKKHKDKKKNKDQHPHHPHHHHNQQSSSNPRPRSLYDWRSEDARRSCDTDPRFSFDGGRLSLDCSSFDLPRASWDGNLLLGRPSASASASAVNSAFPPRLDGGLIPVEEDPGGTTQTREYYADTSQRRRRSLDRSASVRRTPPAADPDEPRTNSSNARVSNYECYFWDSFDCRECPPKKEKPSGRWSRARSLWGLLPKRAKSEKNGVERSMSVVDGRQLNRGSTNAASSFGGGGGAAAAAVIGGRHSFSGIGGSVRRGGGLGGEWNGQVRKRREELPTMERNRSARYSPGRLDNGMLRFYLTPMRGSTSRRRTGRFHGSNSITRSVLRLY